MPHVIERDTLGIRNRIGSGGQASVYEAPGVAPILSYPVVYKEYRPNMGAAINRGALEQMCDAASSLPAEGQQKLYSLAAWPSAVVVHQGQMTGFLMPAIPESFHLNLITASGPQTSLAEIQHLLNAPEFIQARGITLTEKNKYQLLTAISQGLTFFHRNRVAVGDISPKNLLFNLAGRPSVYFIDCDSMRIAGQSVAHQLETDGWQVPRGPSGAAAEELATEQSDSFKFGLLALRLLAGDHDARDLSALPVDVFPPIRDLIAQCLTNRPGQRPPPHTWDYALVRAVEYAPDEVRQAHTAYTLPTPVAPPGESPASDIKQPMPYQTPPPTIPGKSSSTHAGAWIALAAAFIILIGFIGLGSLLTDSSPSPHPSSYTTPTWSTTPSTTPSTTSPTTAWANPRPTSPPAPRTPTIRMRPPGVLSSPDTYGENCEYKVRGGGGWATMAGRGSDVTSCGLTRNVLEEWWDDDPTPSEAPRELYVRGGRGLSCTTVPGALCVGDRFVMDCRMDGGQPWIICTGGRNAVVYIY